MRARAMFEQVDALPCAKAKRARNDRNRQAHRKHRGLYVSRHIIRAFEAVRNPRHGQIICGGRETLKETLQVTLNTGIGVFLDQKRTGCVTNEKVHHPVAFGETGDQRREFVKPGA